MAEEKQVEIGQESDIVTARKSGRDMADSIGFRLLECTQIATAISELARNIFLYAGKGVVIIRIKRENSGKQGIEIVAIDHGPGIENIEVVMQDGFSTSKGLGLGLPGTKRLMDEFDIESELHKGTKVKVAKWLKKRMK